MSTVLLSEALRAIRWLSPDAELDRLTPDARSFIASTADELTASWQRYADGGELPSHEPVVTRSAREALARWTSECAACGASPTDPDGAAWRSALRGVLAARMRAEASAADDLVPEIDAFRRSLTESSLALPERWSPAWSLLLPGFFTVYRHVIAGGSMASGVASGSSPWGPLVALWARGCWPTLCPSGRLIVWVPTRRGGVIVPDGDAEPSAAPVPLVPSQLYGGELLPPGRVGVVLSVDGAKMSIVPLGRRNWLSAADGREWLQIGTPDASADATLDHEPPAADAVNGAFVLRVNNVGTIHRNGAPTTSAALAAGDVLTFASRPNKALYYLGASANDVDVYSPFYDR